MDPTEARTSWGSMLRTCRAAIVVLVVGDAALIVPPETHDMLTFLDNDRAWAAFSFQLALAVLGSSAWYWSRAALSARFGLGDMQRSWIRDDPRFDWGAFTWLPRVLLLVAFLAGMVIAVMNDSYKTAAGSAAFGVLALAFTIFRPRTEGSGPPPAPRSGFRVWISHGWRQRLSALLLRAPFGHWPAMFLLALGLLPLVVGLFETFALSLHAPALLAAVFPGPGIAVLLLGLMIGPLVAATFVFDGMTLQWRWGHLRLGLRRPPVVSAIMIYVFVIVPALFHVHTVRLIDAGKAEPQRLDVLFKAWADQCAPKNGPVRPIIVAISGGATRAGLWGAAVVDQVLQAQKPDGPALFAISSVSGGSLGAAGAMTLLSQQVLPCKGTGLGPLRPAVQQTVPLAGDALGPLLGGWLLDDIPRAAFEPLAAALRWATNRQPNGGDSAEAIEHGFTDLWEDVRPSGALDWDRPFLSLFYDQTGAYRAGMPLWFANGTDATTGNRVITTPILATQASNAPWPFRGARDFHALMKSDVRIATAINNTARFPYLEPFGEMLPADGGKQTGSLVDGGYFENEGLQTALELAEWLKEQSRPDRPVVPIIVQATGDGEADIKATDVMTCDNASDGPYVADSEHSAWQILAPLMGLYHVRGGHSAVLLRQAHDQFCGAPPRFVHFYLPADNGTAVPLNWVLSNDTGRFIWSAFTNDQVNNADELKQLGAALKP